MQNVSFTSLICPIPISKMTKLCEGIPIKNFVREPWSWKETVKAPKAYTTEICDCTAGGITDGQNVVMFHLCPETEANKVFDVVEKNILDKVDLKSNCLQGFLLGSEKIYEDSQLVFKHLQFMMEKNNIPCTFMKGGHGLCSSILYDSVKDTWFISNKAINSVYSFFKNPKKVFLQNVFDEVKIADCDKLVMDVRV